MGVGATGSVAPSSFHFIRKVSVSIKRVSPFGLWSKALVLTTKYIVLKWSLYTKVNTSVPGSIL
ncbi:hypothetical protein Gotur_025086 [Gossypium turneri]